MNHPNSEINGCKTKYGNGVHPQEQKKWDQRIPNEPLLDRRFLIERPPIVYNRRVQTTNPCIGLDHNWLLVDPLLECQSAEHWLENLTRHNLGLPLYTSTRKVNCKDLEKLKKEFPDRPWLHGINRNIDAESHLLALEYYTPEDCINSDARMRLRKQNLNANNTLYNRYHQISNNYLSETPFYWNNQSKMRIQEPRDFDYTRFLSECAAKKIAHMKGVPPKTNCK